MAADPDAEQVAETLKVSVGLLRRRLRASRAEEGELTFPETAALSRLDRCGPTTSGTLARLEQISPQAMGATLAGLETQGLVARAADPGDGRRALLSMTDTGRRALADRRSLSTQQLTTALTTHFTPAEIAQLGTAAALIERLAQVL